MEHLSQSTFSSLPNSLDSSFHDCVEHFDLSYKIDSANEKLDSLIHYHECYEVVFYISANIEVYLDDIHFLLNNYDVLLIPPFKMHRIIYPKCQTYIRYVFYFTEDHIRNAFSPLLLKKALHFFNGSGIYKISLSAPEHMHLNAVLHNMYEHSLEISSKKRELLVSYAAVILQELFFIGENHPLVKKETYEYSPVEQILKYINDNYSQNITLEDLEDKFYLNKSYICRIFRKTIGLSVINYLQYKRILEAQQMLLKTDLPIIDIAMECGFSNIQHFYRVFKKVTHLTPNEYKKHQLRPILGQALSFSPSRSDE